MMSRHVATCIRATWCTRVHVCACVGTRVCACDISGLMKMIHILAFDLSC